MMKRLAGSITTDANPEVHNQYSGGAASKKADALSSKAIAIGKESNTRRDGKLHIDHISQHIQASEAHHAAAMANHEAAKGGSKSPQYHMKMRDKHEMARNKHDIWLGASAPRHENF